MVFLDLKLGCEFIVVDASLRLKFSCLAINCAVISNLDEHACSYQDGKDNTCVLTLMSLGGAQLG